MKCYTFLEGRVLEGIRIKRQGRDEKFLYLGNANCAECDYMAGTYLFPKRVVRVDPWKPPSITNADGRDDIGIIKEAGLKLYQLMERGVKDKERPEFEFLTASLAEDKDWVLLCVRSNLEHSFPKYVRHIRVMRGLGFEVCRGYYHEDGKQPDYLICLSLGASIALLVQSPKYVDSVAISFDDEQTWCEKLPEEEANTICYNKESLAEATNFARLKGIYCRKKLPDEERSWDLLRLCRGLRR